MARKDYIVRITKAEGLLIKGGTSKKWQLRPPENLRIDSALSAQSAVADATERWITRTALLCPPDELHEYTILAEVWEPQTSKKTPVIRCYATRYLFSLTRQRKPEKIY